MSKAPKLTPLEQKRADRADRLQRTLARFPPSPVEGGAYVVGADGKLLREGEETPVETPVKEA